MDEILKRLAEIKAEAEALRVSEDENRREQLVALLAEKKELEAKIEDEKVLDELTKEVPVAEDQEQEDAEVTEEEAPAEEVEVEEPEQEEPAADEPVAEVDEVVEEETVEPEAQNLPVAASGNIKPVDQEVPVTASANQVHLIASGNVGGTNPGNAIGANDIDRIHRLASKSDPGRATIKSVFASMAVGSGKDVINDRNSPEYNTSLMASASRGTGTALTAAAGFCGPDDIVLDICAAGSAARPVLDLFRTVPVRGPFRYMKTATLAEVAPGITVWDVDDQDDVDPDDNSTWKPCVDLSCRSETLVTPYAIPACTTLGVWQQLSAPEQITNWLGQMEKQYSVVAETALLDRIRAQSYVYSAGSGGQGLWTTLQAVLAHVESDVGNVNRDTTEGYTLIAPYGFTAALAADEGMRGLSNNLGVARIQAILRDNYGITIVESFETDSTVAASYRTGVTELGGMSLGGGATVFTQSTSSPDVYPVYLLKADSFVAGQSDVVEAGYYRDGNLVRQNLVRYFWEGMEFLEKTCDNLSFVFELGNCPSGTAPALTTAPSCSSAL